MTTTRQHGVRQYHRVPVQSKGTIYLTPDRRPFPRRMREALCAALLDLPRMAGQDRRDYLLRQLALDHRGLQSVQRAEEPHVDMMEMVAAAYEYDGALQTLLEVVSFLHPNDSRKVRLIEDIVNVVDPRELLHEDEREQLLDLLDQASPGTVAGAFHHSTQSTVAEAGIDPRHTATVARYVEALAARPDRLPALFDFVDYLAHHPPQSVGSALHQWMDTTSQRLGFHDRAAVERLCRSTENRVVLAGRFYLVAELRADKMRTGRYFLGAWRQHGDEPEESIFQSDRSVEWNEAITDTHRLMRELIADVENTAVERILELIVPRSLMTEAIDQWPVDQVLPAPIGTRYPLVLRSFDRLEDQSLHADWARNWRWIKQHDLVAGSSAIREVESHDLATIHALRGALLREGAPAIVLLRTALAHSEDLDADAFTAGLHGGASIMLWSRDASTSSELAASVRLAVGEGLLSLREHIFQLRLGALEPSEPTAGGAHITLVFDDFDRIPERFRNRSRLCSPEQRRSQYP
ncbi:MAG TPA: hypothetical protein VN408_29080 [Actinoplanes sp.]|nr:hypothetical protein [Actinoplanes sp.]